MGFCAALQPVRASIVEFTTADAGVASFTIVSTWLALTIVAAEIWFTAVVVGCALSALGVTYISLAAVAKAENKRCN